MEQKDFKILSLLLGIGWVGWIIYTNSKQDKDIAALKMQLAANADKIAALTGGTPAGGSVSAAHSGFSNFAEPPESYQKVYGAAEGSLKDYDAKSVFTLGQPTVVVEQKGGNLTVRALPG